LQVAVGLQVVHLHVAGGSENTQHLSVVVAGNQSVGRAGNLVLRTRDGLGLVQNGAGKWSVVPPEEMVVVFRALSMVIVVVVLSARRRVTISVFLRLAVDPATFPFSLMRKHGRFCACHLGQCCFFAA
jgi:hypothetical protein